jgi:CubicO group peptidase (beta-lactamase class C family)
MSQQDSIEVAIRAYVDAGALAGAATLVWRNGRVVQTAIVDCRDLVTNLPVERGTIFRIASMTKPLTTVAALMLYDEGRFALDEPIARLAPELAPFESCAIRKGLWTKPMRQSGRSRSAIS